ncbi:hypothetical protein D3C77_246020 [compost metagenome]
MADLYSLRQRRGSGGVLQEGDVISLQCRCLPGIRQFCAKLVNRQQLRCGVLGQHVQRLQAVVQGAGGQQQARLGIVDDRQQSLLMMTAGRLRRIGRHGNHPGVQAAKERRNVIRTTGEEQNCPIGNMCPRLQCCGNGSCAQIQVLVGQHRLLLRIVGQKAQGHPLRGLRSALCQCLDQRNREFEGVRHGRFLPESVREIRARQWHVARCTRAPCACRAPGDVPRETDGQGK